jgi:VIT1/CCC1 family predicted Fe2+/Mn2+ transporter
VIFGLIMALTFTGSLSVAEAGREEVRTVLIGALGCNIAWGLVDGVMYVITSLVERARQLGNARPAAGAVLLTRRDLLGAVATFLFVFTATIPVVIPFLFMPDAIRALRVSNAIALVMLFTAGWTLGRYAKLNAWLMGLSMLGIGVVLVLATIALGG